MKDVNIVAMFDQQCPPNTIDFGSRDRQPTTIPLGSGQGHMSARDSAKEFILIHALRRERFLVLSCDLTSNPLKILFLTVGSR